MLAERRPRGRSARPALGGVEVRNLPVSVVPSVGQRLDGILGYDFLEDFRGTFDYPAGRVTFERL
jgi:hypothetical protein